MTEDSQVGTSEEKQKSKGISIGTLLAGLYLIGGGMYQILNVKWFPGFPIQIDGVLGIFEMFFGRNAGLYISALLALLLGAICILVSGNLLLRKKTNER
jgi:hypothetical protein